MKKRITPFRQPSNATPLALARAVAAIRADSAANGTAGFSTTIIDAEVAAVRAARRRAR